MDKIRRMDGKYWSEAVLDKYNHEWLHRKGYESTASWEDIENLKDLPEHTDENGTFVWLVNGYHAIRSNINPIELDGFGDGHKEIIAFHGSNNYVTLEDGTRLHDGWFVLDEDDNVIYEQSLEGIGYINEKVLPKELIDYVMQYKPYDFFELGLLDVEDKENITDDGDLVTENGGLLTEDDEKEEE